MSVIEHSDDWIDGYATGFADQMKADTEVERLRAEWRKADDGWIACRQQLEGAVDRLDIALAALDRIAGIWEGEARGIAREALDAIGGQ